MWLAPGWSGVCQGGRISCLWAPCPLDAPGLRSLLHAKQTCAVRCSRDGRGDDGRRGSGRGAEGRVVREQGGGQKGEKDLKEGWRWGGGGGAVTHTMPPPPPSGHALHEKHPPPPPPPDGPGSRRRRGRLRGEPQQRRRVVDGLEISQTFALTQSLIVITDGAPPPAAALPLTHTHTLPLPPHTLLSPDHICMFSRQ